MTLVAWYLGVTMGMWLGAVIARLIDLKGKPMNDITTKSMLYGIVGCMFWPVVVVMIIFLGTKGMLKEINKW